MIQQSPGFCHNNKKYSPVFMKQKIAVYVGTGSSHSWLWFVDVFERYSIYDLVFIDEYGIQQNNLSRFDTLVVSGGDTFSIAESLGPKGAKSLHLFMNRGGVYIGSCAGAYLPMRSSKPHLNLFNFVEVKIANLSKFLPQAKQMRHKSYVCYGCDYIFHPVREEVRLKNHNMSALNKDSFSAPLYGGPSMIPSPDCQVLASYQDFTDKTAFLVDKELAFETLYQKAAIVRAGYGKGLFYLFGPHLEHPGFPVANKLLVDTLTSTTSQSKKQNRVQNSRRLIKNKDLIQKIKREISNSRIIAVGLETSPQYWLIGHKSYEPTKIRLYLESIWSRLPTLEKQTYALIFNHEEEELVSFCQKTTNILKLLKKNINISQASCSIAKDVFSNLKIMNQIFLNIYFRTLNLDS